MAEIVTAAWALVVHDCDVKAGHVMETISSRYSRIPASVPGVFSSQISSHKDSLELELLPAVVFFSCMAKKTAGRALAV